MVDRPSWHDYLPTRQDNSCQERPVPVSSARFDSKAVELDSSLISVYYMPRWLEPGRAAYYTLIIKDHLGHEFQALGSVLPTVASRDRLWQALAKRPVSLTTSKSSAATTSGSPASRDAPTRQELPTTQAAYRSTACPHHSLPADASTAQSPPPLPSQP